ncbi:GntR family transcriptional regulator [Neisseria sp. Ec49-e6-T10]|uniref:GntR family transcriptional regulator n=1 Tax=Neisseria sp. Ec49-e6-T10 TaxID=3140744 RepID=UPI003EB73070
MQDKTLQKLQKQPLYRQVEEHILSKINEGYFLINEALPSEWDLAKLLDVSQGTVRKALTELVEYGILSRQQGVGTFVNPPPSDWGKFPLNVSDKSNLIQEEPKQEILSLSKVTIPDAATHFLNLRRAQQAWQITSLWRLNAKVIAVDYAYLSCEFLEHLSARVIKESGGLYSFLQRKHATHIAVKEEQLFVMRLAKEEAVLLQADTADAATLIIRMTQNLNAEPIEWRKRILLNHEFAIVIR